jgi:hydrogenase maturation protease
MKLIIGLGAYAMGDDSIGLRLADAIAERGLDKDFEVASTSHDSLQLLSYFSEDEGKGPEKVLLIDCMRSGRHAGDFVVFAPEEVESRKALGGITTHEGDVLKVLQLGKELALPLPPIRILGIEPQSTEQSMELSEPLKARFEEYLAAAVKAIRTDW